MGKSEMGRETLWVPQDGLGDPRGGLGRAGDSRKGPGRVDGPSGSSETGWGTGEEVREGPETLGEVWDR